MDKNILYALSHNQVLHNTDFENFAEIETRNTFDVKIKFNFFYKKYTFQIFSIHKII